MALVPGLVAVLRIVPLGNKVALREMVQRVLSASLPPTRSSVEETLEESLRGGHPAGPGRSGGCSSHPEQPGRHASQELGALHRRSLLPKTGKIATQVAMHLYFPTASSR